MKALTFFLAMLGIAFFVVAKNYHASNPDTFWNERAFSYRMTVTIDTPEGLKTGEAVRRVMLHREINFLPQNKESYFLGGAEATVVDLGKRGKVFALLRGSTGDAGYGLNVALKAFPLKAQTPLGTEIILNLNQWPMFVTFKDLNDPLTVEKIQELAVTGKAPHLQMNIKKDRFEEIFGADVKLKEVKLEITDEPVTRYILHSLPWLENLKGYLDGARIRASNELSNTLNRYDFIQ